MMWLAFFAIQLSYIVAAQKNNVCTSIPDYSSLASNKNCWYNPNVLSDLPSIVKRNKYPLEKHTVTTKDGYILTVYRLFNNSTNNSQKKRPVIIQHGIGGSAAFWVLQNRKSLAFRMYDNGFDVWLPTIRGGMDSTKHVSLSYDDPAYWNFGFHEMGIYDIPAIVDHIVETTNRKGDIVYIGHSMGSTMSYVYASTMNRHAEKNLRGIISFSPVAYLGHVKGIFAIIAPFADLLKNFLDNLGIYAIGNIPAINLVIQRFCATYPTIIGCVLGLALGTGLSLGESNPAIFPVLTSYFPSGMSIKTIEHYSQILNGDGQFRQFDYGKENVLKYSSQSPPEYEMSKISLPVYLFLGNQDFIATKEDAETLELRLNSSRNVEKHYFNYAHNDFFIGRHFEKLYDTIFRVIAKMGTT